MAKQNTETKRPFLGRIPRPAVVEKMIKEAEQEVACLRVMLKASREMEAVERDRPQEAAQ